MKKRFPATYIPSVDALQHKYPNIFEYDSSVNCIMMITLKSANQAISFIVTL